MNNKRKKKKRGTEVWPPPLNHWQISTEKKKKVDFFF
jgi:hypothetical protein